MSDVAIKVENLGKMYRIGEKQESYNTFRDTLNNVITAPFRRLINIGKPTKPDELIWALKDVSFEVKHGEVVGIIGRNGSGKSTLLKILSQITEPTKGQATVYGRVGSLLEVGTGFHPELTGRENIYLNGAILGMSRIEINRKFDEIVDFAEIEKFIDTQVKHYSSGMYMRLAFAVAAHLDTEILVVDEVLAVGDISFQKKCLRKMDNVSRNGRTILFVSHNMPAIKQLCHKGVVLKNGDIDFTGNINEVIYYYQKSMKETVIKQECFSGIQINSIRINENSGDTVFRPDSCLMVDIELYTDRLLPSCYLNLIIEDQNGDYLIHSRTDMEGLWPTFDKGSHHIYVKIPRLSIRSGLYTLWFRLCPENKPGTDLIDSDRIMLEVDGPLVSGFVSVPCLWSWSA